MSGHITLLEEIEAKDELIEQLCALIKSLSDDVTNWKAKYLEARKSGYAEGLEEAVRPDTDLLARYQIALEAIAGPIGASDEKAKFQLCQWLAKRALDAAEKESSR